MFEWIDHELAQIRTKRFHIVDGPASDTFREAVLTSPLPAPPSYVEFVLRYGNAKLYRMTGLDVSNGSDRRLPFLSIGIRERTGKLQGGVWLPVGHIAPGQMAVVVKDTYRDLLDPTDVEAYPLPDPEPEERTRYWEFRGTT